MARKRTRRRFTAEFLAWPRQYRAEIQKWLAHLPVEAETAGAK